MKLPICLIGEDNKTLAALKQELEKQPAYAVEPKVCSYGDALERLRGYAGAVIAVMDLSRDPDRAYAVAAELRLAAQAAGCGPAGVPPVDGCRGTAWGATPAWPSSLGN
jgi:hypothetical protein